MSTKVFSTRINPKLIDDVKLLSQQNGESVQDTIEKLIELSLAKAQVKSDPWAKFIMPNYEASSDMVDIMNQKKEKNLKSRKAKRIQISND